MMTIRSQIINTVAHTVFIEQCSSRRNWIKQFYPILSQIPMEAVELNNSPEKSWKVFSNTGLVAYLLIHRANPSFAAAGS